MPDTPTTKYGIARPADEEFINDGPEILRQAFDLIDALMAAAITTTPRPAAGKYGRFHRHPDTGVLSFDNGTGWEEIARHPHANRHAAGGSDPLVVTQAMLAPDVAQVNVGDLLLTSRTTLPGNGRYAFADGGLIDRTYYAEYFAAVGHVHNNGADPGSNLVRLPDMRGRVPVGVDGAAGRLSGPDTLGASYGFENVNLSTAHMPPHAHGGSTGWMDRNNPHQHATSLATQTNRTTQPNNIPMFALGTDFHVAPNYPTTLSDINHLHPIATEGGGVAHTNMQPYLVLNYLVRII